MQRLEKINFFLSNFKINKFNKKDSILNLFTQIYLCAKISNLKKIYNIINKFNVNFFIKLIFILNK